jgi:two-component system NtrC family response regulator
MMDKRYLQDLMEITDGDIGLAVEYSGISQSRLYGLLKKYGIRRSN